MPGIGGTVLTVIVTGQGLRCGWGRAGNGGVGAGAGAGRGLGLGAGFGCGLGCGFGAGIGAGGGFGSEVGADVGLGVGSADTARLGRARTMLSETAAEVVRIATPVVMRR
jgi:hypothetical protein